MISSLRRDAARAFLLLLLLGATALAQASGIEVRSPSAKLINTTPGRPVTFTAVVVNQGAEADEFTERLVLPPGCQKIAPPDAPFRLEAGAQTLRVLAVLIPKDMAAGRFDLRYTAQGRRDPSSNGSLNFAIQVAPVDQLELVVDPQPNPVLAGDAYAIHLRVTNLGNSRISGQLTHRSSSGFAVSADARAFSLDAGATREILCRVQVDKAFALHTSHAVTFTFTAVSSSGQALKASQASVVEIIPLITGNRDPFHYLPMLLSFMALAESGHVPQLQAQLAGEGSLDEEGEHRVDFLLRGPDIQNARIFGERDEYGASYHGENLDVDLGDRIYSLSALTEQHSLGRGVGVRWHDDDMAAGAFYMSTRFRQVNTGELGAFVRKDIATGFSFQGNFLRKTGGDFLSERAASTNILTLGSQHHIGKMLDLKLEAGASLGDDGKAGVAYHLDGRGQLPGKLDYAVEYTHASPNFDGYYSNSDTAFASIQRPLTSQLTARASFTRYAGNAALNDILSSVVNRENSWNAGLDYAFSQQTGLTLAWQHVNRADILLPAAYEFTEDSLRFGAGHDFGKFRIQGGVDIGLLDNAITAESGPFQRYSGAVVWNPTPRQSYSIFGSYGPSPFTGSTEKSLSAGVSGHWQVRDHLAANLSYSRNQYDSLTGHEQDQALASVVYQLQNKRTISLIGRVSRASSGGRAEEAINEAALFVTYSIPLNMPVSRKTSTGALQGRLTDAASGAGIARAVLQVGEQFAVTDRDGLFDFPALKPGACELRLRPDSLSPRMAMVTALPMKLRILPADTVRVRLTANPACSLSVCVTRYEFAGGSSLAASGALREAGGQEGVALEITNGHEVWRAQTDRTGRASFERLLGGRWTLRGASNDLPALHTLENPERTLTLKPGEDQKVALRVMPQRRTLRLLETGTIR